MQPAKLTLRVARREEADRLLAFYKKNPDRFLLPRPFGDFQTAIDRGQFFVIADGDEIVAASGVFDYEANQPFVELAETFVSQSIRGFGLQGVFFKVRIASVIVYQSPSVGITTAVDSQNKASRNTTVGQGFEIWTTPVTAAHSSCLTCPNKSTERVCCCDFYLLPVDKARDAVSNLLVETASEFIMLSNKNGDEIELRCECAILTGELREVLAGFVAGETW